MNPHFVIQEREAVQALAVLEACVKSCGPLFHSEVGKFKFLNEMIKLVSPRWPQPLNMLKGRIHGAKIRDFELLQVSSWAHSRTYQEESDWNVICLDTTKWPQGRDKNQWSLHYAQVAGKQNIFKFKEIW